MSNIRFLNQILVDLISSKKMFFLLVVLMILHLFLDLHKCVFCYMFYHKSRGNRLSLK